MKIVRFNYSYTIYIVMIDESIHTNTTNLNDTQTLLRQNYEMAVASCSDASTASTQSVRDTWGCVSRLGMQEPSRCSRTGRSDPQVSRLEQELEELRQQRDLDRQQRELDLQRIASLEARQQRFASLEAQMLRFLAAQLGGGGGSGGGSGEGGGSGGGSGDGGGSGG